MVERSSFGRPVAAETLQEVQETYYGSCASCGQVIDPEFPSRFKVDISNGYTFIFSGAFCSWDHYQIWRLKWVAEREKLLANNVSD